eukprot:5619396-Amphidinium_carterae.1
MAQVHEVALAEPAAPQPDEENSEEEVAFVENKDPKKRKWKSLSGASAPTKRVMTFKPEVSQPPARVVADVPQMRAPAPQPVPIKAEVGASSASSAA